MNADTNKHTMSVYKFISIHTLLNWGLGRLCYQPVIPHLLTLMPYLVSVRYIWSLYNITDSWDCFSLYNFKLAVHINTYFTGWPDALSKLMKRMNLIIIIILQLQSRWLQAFSTHIDLWQGWLSLPLPSHFHHTLTHAGCRLGKRGVWPSRSLFAMRWYVQSISSGRFFLWESKNMPKKT